MKIRGRSLNLKFLPKFRIGQVVYHRIYHYRAVVFSIDFCESDDEKKPHYYSLLVDDDNATTYVPETHLTKCPLEAPISNPKLSFYFSEYLNGQYKRFKKSTFSSYDMNDNIINLY